MIQKIFCCLIASFLFTVSLPSWVSASISYNWTTVGSIAVSGGGNITWQACKLLVVTKNIGELYKITVLATDTSNRFVPSQIQLSGIDDGKIFENINGGWLGSSGQLSINVSASVDEQVNETLSNQAASYQSGKFDPRNISYCVSSSPFSNINIPGSSVAGAALGITTAPTNQTALDGLLGKTPALYNAFFGWQNSDGTPAAFPLSYVQQVAQQGSTPMITWEPGQVALNNLRSTAVTQTSYNLAAINSGVYDKYIAEWADAARAANTTIYIRLMHEMNGDWFPWGNGINGNTPAQYVAAYQRIVNIFRRERATKVQFIWCISTGANYSNIQEYFPGDAYVNWVAMDGYNRSAVNPKTLYDLFSGPYADLVGISERPVMIGETGTVELSDGPGGKASWVRTSFLDTIPKYFPRIKAITYTDTDANGLDYLIDSSPDSIAAFQRVFAGSYYQTPAPTESLLY